MTSCRYCFGPLFCKGSGRTPVFCSKACKQAHWRLERNGFKRIRVSASARSLSLRNVTGTGVNNSLPLRNAGSFSQVDWTEEN